MKRSFDTQAFWKRHRPRSANANISGRFAAMRVKAFNKQGRRTDVEDQTIIELYLQRSEKAIVESQLKYSAFCLHILIPRHLVKTVWFVGEASRGLPLEEHHVTANEPFSTSYAERLVIGSGYACLCSRTPETEITALTDDPLRSPMH